MAAAAAPRGARMDILLRGGMIIMVRPPLMAMAILMGLRKATTRPFLLKVNSLPRDTRITTARSTPLLTTAIIPADRRRLITPNGATTRATEPPTLRHHTRGPPTTPPLPPTAPTAAQPHGSTTTSTRRRSNTAVSRVTWMARTTRMGTLPCRRIPRITRRGTRAMARRRRREPGPPPTRTDGLGTTAAGAAGDRRRARSTPTAEGVGAVIRPADPLFPPCPQT